MKTEERQSYSIPAFILCEGPDRLPEGAGEQFLEKRGVKFLDKKKGDLHLLEIEIPKDWVVEEDYPTSQILLIDNQGQRLARINFKAGITLVLKRFKIERQEADGRLFFQVSDFGRPVHSTSPTAILEDRYEQHNAEYTPRKSAEQWLAKQYPDWQNRFE